MTDKERIDRIRRQQVKRRQDMALFGKDYIVGTITLDDIDFLLHQVEELEQHVAVRDALLLPDGPDLANDTERK